MERSATSDDVVACPNCDSRNLLRIRWIPDIGRPVHERTELGCAGCDTWFTAKEDRWCFAAWNHWACEQWAQSGREIPHAELYRLLSHEAQEEQIERVAAKAVLDYLTEHFANNYPLTIGDWFESKRAPKGFWSLISMEAVYGTNTGPFCILRARNVLPSGILGDKWHEFWSHQSELLKIPPFWKPTVWRQVKPGDACKLNGQDGLILQVNTEARKALIRVDCNEIELRTLSGLHVPISRFVDVTPSQP